LHFAKILFFPGFLAVYRIFRSARGDLWYASRPPSTITAILEISYEAYFLGVGDQSAGTIAQEAMRERKCRDQSGIYHRQS
jgi:hypothetical protein